MTSLFISKSFYICFIKRFSHCMRIYFYVIIVFISSCSSGIYNLNTVRVDYIPKNSVIKLHVDSVIVLNKVPVQKALEVVWAGDTVSSVRNKTGFVSKKINTLVLNTGSNICNNMKGFSGVQYFKSTNKVFEPTKRRYIDWGKIYMQAAILFGFLLLGTLLYFYADPVLGAFVIFVALWYVLYISKVV